jgi:hypothetical protein
MNRAISPPASATPATMATTDFHPSSGAAGAVGAAVGDIAGSGEPVPASLWIASDVAM